MTVARIISKTTVIHTMAGTSMVGSEVCSLVAAGSPVDVITPMIFSGR